MTTSALKGHSMSQKRAEILVLVADRGLLDLVLDSLGNRHVTVAGSPSEARTLLAVHTYALFIATNFGVSPWEALSVIPTDRSYPVLFVSGHWDQEIEAVCREKHLPFVKAPFTMDVLREGIRLALGE